MQWDEAYLQHHVTSFGSRPVRVLTTWHFGRPPATPASVHAERLAFEHDSALAQGSWLRLSTNARQVFDYDETGQYIQLDQPQIVLEAIREVLNHSARTAGAESVQRHDVIADSKLRRRELTQVL